jgi:hypothetical protein
MRVSIIVEKSTGAEQRKAGKYIDRSEKCKYNIKKNCV